MNRIAEIDLAAQAAVKKTLIARKIQTALFRLRAVATETSLGEDGLHLIWKSFAPESFAVAMTVELERQRKNARENRRFGKSEDK